MDLQQIMLAAVLILQLITILVVIIGKKQGRGAGDARRPGAESRGDKKDADPRRGGGGPGRKPADSRNGGGKPQQPARPQQSQPAAGIDPMEKSLRDINLRLKNAEREQENARKKFQEGGSAGSSPREPRENRDSRPHQRGGSGRIERGVNRDFNRDQKREARPERPFRAEQENAPHPAPQAERPAPPPEQPVTAPAAPDIAVNDTGVSEDRLQHGRKFTAKRRQLPPDIAPEAAAPETVTPAAEPQAAETAQDVQTEGADIQFGRR